MDNLLWGIVVLLAGIFIASYGNVLIRFALAFLGFAIGYSLVMWLGGGLDDVLRIVVGIVVGGILAGLFYMLVKFTLYLAGGIMGFVLMVVLLALFRLSGLDLGVIGWVLVAAATALGRVGQPDDVGAAVALLLSPGSAWITGQRIEVSGGQSL